MNNEPQSTSDNTAEVADLKIEVTALRRTVTTLLGTVLFLSLALNAVFLWQGRVVRGQLSAARTELAQYQRRALPVMDEFLTRLQRFASAYPDFAPILGKYVPAKTNASARINPQLSPAK